MIYKSRDRSCCCFSCCCCCCCRLGYPLKLATRHTICNSARKMRFEYRNYCQISTIYNLRSLIEAPYNWLVLRSHFACRSCFAHIWRSDNFRHRSCSDAIAGDGSFHCKTISKRERERVVWDWGSDQQVLGFIADLGKYSLMFGVWHFLWSVKHFFIKALSDHVQEIF